MWICGRSVSVMPLLLASSGMLKLPALTSIIVSRRPTKGAINLDNDAVALITGLVLSF